MRWVGWCRSVGSRPRWLVIQLSWDRAWPSRRQCEPEATRRGRRPILFWACELEMTDAPARSAAAHLEVLLVNATLGERGGVTVDVDNIARGLVDRGHRPRTVTSLRGLVPHLRTNRNALVHVFG